MNLKTQTATDSNDILLIEESIDLRVDLMVKLGAMGYEVYAAPSYEQAIHRLQNRQFSAVLTSDKLSAADSAALNHRVSRMDISKQPSVFSVSQILNETELTDEDDAWHELGSATPTRPLPIQTAEPSVQRLQ